MQDIILSHKSALVANRQIRINPSEVEILHYVNQLLLTSKKCKTSPIEILVKSKTKVHQSWKFKYRVCSTSLPKNSIKQLSENIHYVCPELLLVQFSSILPYEHLALIALEFCGTYSIDPQTHNFEKDLTPATTPKMIENYIKCYEKHNPNFRGKSKLKDVVEFIKPNSASPMESRLFIKLCGKRKKGFYGCCDLEMNQPVKLSDDASKIAGQKIVTPDILNEKLKVAIEYNSAQHHESSDQRQKDARRRDALVHDGWKVFSITPQQYYNENTFHVLAIQILKTLGQNYRFKLSNFSKLRHDAWKLLD